MKASAMLETGAVVSYVQIKSSLCKVNLDGEANIPAWFSSLSFAQHQLEKCGMIRFGRKAASRLDQSRLNKRSLFTAETQRTQRFRREFYFITSAPPSASSASLR